MEFKNSFLAQLFSARQGKTGSGKEVPRPTEAPETEQPAPRPCHRLELPAEHAVFALWNLYCEQAGWQPEPELTLEEPSDPILSEDVARAELLRLQMLVNTSANGRLEQIQRRTKPGTEEEEEEVIRPDADAQVLVFLSKDCLTAWVLVYPPSGAGKELDQKTLEQALKDHQVRFGVDRALLEALPEDPARYFRLVTVARGIAVEHGTDGRVVDMYPRVLERKHTADEHNRMDYTNLDLVHNVEEGGVICRILPPTEGTPGRTVQREDIPAKRGKPAAVPKGRGTALSEDGGALVATMTGHVEFSGQSFQVKPVLDIPGNVDFSVGNINYVGDVAIHGDVCSGFTVRAMGSITVDGVVEACTLEAGRDLIVKSGVQGDNQAVIRAQRSVYVKYLENTCVYAKMDLEAECIINCDVYCDGAVTVRSGHRSVIGGKIHAAHEVSAGTVGSRAGIQTNVVLGGRPCEDFDLELLTKEIQELGETLERTERQPDSPNKLSQMSKLRMQQTLSRRKLEMLEKDRAERQEEESEPGPRRMVCDTVLPGTVLTIDGVLYRFDHSISPCVATLVEDEIHLH